jgi:3-dehydroquinate synthase
MKLDFVVKSQQGSYDVNFYKSVKEIEKYFLDQSELFVMIDKNISEIFKNQLKFTNRYPTYLIEANDLKKSLSQAEEIINWLVENQASKSSVILAIGGGFIQDLATFVSHVFNRGINWVYIPTTLLSQSDSCIGAKCGINVMNYKNQVGVFHAPTAVYIVEEFISTLTILDRVSGLGEILKLSLTGRNQFYAEFKEYICSNDLSVTRILPLIKQSLNAKKAIIEIDEYEKDVRRVLNYGHTFGHSLETITNYKIPHGIAVLFGIDVINYLGMKWGVTEAKYYFEINDLIKKILIGGHINVGVPKFKTIELIDGIKKDKKMIKGNINFAILSSPGNIKIVPKKIDDYLYQQVSEYMELDELFSST